MELKLFIAAHILVLFFNFSVTAFDSAQKDSASVEGIYRESSTVHNAASSKNHEYDLGDEIMLRGRKDCTCELCRIRQQSSILKCFSTDLDGTFVAKNHGSMARNFETFGKALKKGYDVFFCTGRGLNEAMRLVPQHVLDLGFRGFPGVYHNGAIVYGKDGTLLRMAHFREEIVTRIIETVFMHGHEKYTIFMSMNKWMMLYPDLDFINDLRKRLGIWSEIFPATVEETMAEAVIKVMIIDYEKIRDAFSDIDGVEFVSRSAVPRFTDLTPPGVTKATGLEIALKDLGVTPAECGYIGDAANDIEAMELVEHSFAVGNSNETVKKYAKHVVSQTNEECAFTVVVEALFDL